MGRRSPMGQQQHHHMPPMGGNMHIEHEQYGQQREYSRGDPMMDMQPDHWRYQNDRRQAHMMPPFQRDRHLPPQIGPPQMHGPPPPHPQHLMGPHYGHKMDMPLNNGRPQMPPYYHMNHQYTQQPGVLAPQMSGPPQQAPLPPMSLDGAPSPVGMHYQRRSSPKYDRHGNLIRGMPNYIPGASPPRNFMPPGDDGHLMHHQPGAMIEGPYEDLRLGCDNVGMMFGQRWIDGIPEGGPNLGPLGPLPPYSGHMNQQQRAFHDERFLEPQRFQQSKQSMFNPNEQQQPQLNQPIGQPDVPRYAKWRERRDVITHLDRQTAQSSSRTDSLKSSLQQQLDQKSKRQHSDQQSVSSPSSIVKKSPKSGTTTSANDKEARPANVPSTPTTEPKKGNVKSEPQDISDGEIIDDESSDEDEISDIVNDPKNSRMPIMVKNSYVTGGPVDSAGSGVTKRKRVGGNCESMNYETISDEELDDFMSERKDEGKSGANVTNSSELELLNALGLDWANLVEMSKQSKKEASNSASALKRFSISNYIPTLGITKELAGSDIYELVSKICHM